MDLIKFFPASLLLAWGGASKMGVKEVEEPRRSVKITFLNKELNI